MAADAPNLTIPPDAVRTAECDGLYTLLVGSDWSTVFDSGTRVLLERHALAPFFQRQRWFASKSRTLEQARFTDWVSIRAGANPAFLTIASVEYADGWTDSYLVPLTLVGGEAAIRALETPSAILAKITGARKGVIIDGLQDDDVCNRLVAVAQSADERTTQKGVVRGVGRSRLSSVASPQAWRRGGIDQSNSIAFADDQYVLKLFRRIEPTPNPEYEVGLMLMGRFDRVPALVGAIEYVRPAREPGTLAVVQSQIKHQGSGWQYTIDDLRRYFERVTARITRSDAQEWSPFFAALEHVYLSSATLLGRRTAELHLALASVTGEGFAPEPLRSADLEALAGTMRAHAEASLDALAERTSTLNDATRPLAEAVLSARRALIGRLDRVRLLENAGWRIRVHGDYHLGQILRTEEDFAILDFEGEPARSIAERRAKQSPLKDIAGMVRSFSYAAYAALFAFTTNAPAEYAPLEGWADTWRHWATAAFLDGYMWAIGSSPLLPQGEAYHVLLQAFTIDKALYELSYELNNRPDWVRIPLTGILASDLQS